MGTIIIEFNPLTSDRMTVDFDDVSVRDISRAATMLLGNIVLRDLKNHTSSQSKIEGENENEEN